MISTYFFNVNPCKATVIQRADGELVLGRHKHNHQGQVGAGLAAKITAKTKAEAKKNLFKPAMVIVNEVLMEEITDAPCPSLQKQVNLAKVANYMRQRVRPSDPEFGLQVRRGPSTRGIPASRCPGKIDDM